MGVYPMNYTKEEFKKSLQENGISNQIISKFVELPEVVCRNGNEYKLYINSTFYSIGNMFVNYELNYYSENLIEYLFNSKVFTDVEHSINNLMCELMNAKLIGGDCKK